jgi:hypothetical protein
MRSAQLCGNELKRCLVARFRRHDQFWPNMVKALILMSTYVGTYIITYDSKLAVDGNMYRFFSCNKFLVILNMHIHMYIWNQNYRPISKNLECTNPLRSVIALRPSRSIVTLGTSPESSSRPLSCGIKMTTTYICRLGKCDRKLVDDWRGEI